MDVYTFDLRDESSETIARLLFALYMLGYTYEVAPLLTRIQVVTPDPVFDDLCDYDLEFCALTFTVKEI